MREIDEVRITLLRMFRGAVRLPDEIINEMLKASQSMISFLRTRDAAIKVQAYGRGLLQRFRYHRLITKDFNRQASREYQEYRRNRGIGSSNYAYEGYHINLTDIRHPFLHGYRFSRGAQWEITQDMEGLSAKWHTRAHRESRRALAYRIRRAEPWQDKFAAPYTPYRSDRVFGWLEKRLSRFVKARLNWFAHRSRLGVKALDFSSN